MCDQYYITKRLHGGDQTTKCATSIILQNAHMVVIRPLMCDQYYITKRLHGGDQVTNVRPVLYD